MGKSPTPPDPDKGAIPKLKSNIPVKMDVEQTAIKRKSRKSSDDGFTPPSSPTASKRKVVAGAETFTTVANDPVLALDPLSIPLPDERGSSVNCSMTFEETNPITSSIAQTRVRTYPNDFAGPFYVYFRSKCDKGKPLNVLQITREPEKTVFSRNPYPKGRQNFASVCG